MRPTKLAHKAADRLARRGGLEVELTSLGHPLVVAGFALSISGRFSAVHRGSLSKVVSHLSYMNDARDPRISTGSPKRNGRVCDRSLVRNQPVASREMGSLTAKPA